MTLAQLQRGAQVLVDVRYVPGLPPGAPPVPGVVLDGQIIAGSQAGALAVLEVAVAMPGLPTGQRLTLQEPGGVRADFGVAIVAPAPADAGMWGGLRGAGWPVMDAAPGG